MNNNKYRVRRDIIAGRTVRFFGLAVLLTLVVLIGHLVSQSSPLLFSPSLEQSRQFLLPIGHRPIAAKDVLEGQAVVSHQNSCQLALLNLEDDVLISNYTVRRPCEHALNTVSWLNKILIVDVSQTGIVRITPLQNFENVAEMQRSSTELQAFTPPLNDQSQFSFGLNKQHWQQRVDWSVHASVNWFVSKIKTNENTFLQWNNRHNPANVVNQVYDNADFIIPLPGAGHVARISPKQIEFYTQAGSVTSTFGFKSQMVWAQALPKHRTLLTFDKAGGLTRWTLKNVNGQLTFTPTYSSQFDTDASPVDVVAHANSNAMLLLMNNGDVHILNRVTGEVVATERLSPVPIGAHWFGERIYFYTDKAVTLYNVHNLAGVTTFSSLFAPQEYEGYLNAESVWQTSSGSDYQESKYSLMPLLIGSLKASLLALMIAIPMSVGAAVYTSYFARSKTRFWVKPAIEMLEAIPSVLIGFITAIWLAPLAERFLFSFAFFLVTVPIILFLSALVQRRIVDLFPTKLRHGTELGVSLFIIVLLGYISMIWAPEIVFGLLNIDGFGLLESGWEAPVSKTTIIVAIALGVAISPSIYSLAEDAINGVPSALKQASFALGATRLQTLQMVVVHVAMPGILAAIMLGFGRAFGETMILLMVTGNTPIDSWSFLEGLRSLTANLAIELPEAEVKSAHYHILFLTAAILFAFTFVINTLAELMRQWLRKKARYES